jgi:hypothetical protein
VVAVQAARLVTKSVLTEAILFLALLLQPAAVVVEAEVRNPGLLAVLVAVVP